MDQQESRQNMNQNLGVLALLLTALIFGFFGVFARMIGDELPFLYQSGSRALACSFIFALSSCFFRESWNYPNAKLLSLLAIRSLSGCLSYFGFFWGSIYLNIGTSFFVYFGSTILLSFLFANFIMREALTRIKVFSMLLALLGIFLLSSEKGAVGSDHYYKLLYPFIGGLGYALWNLLPKKMPATYSNFQMNFYDMFIAGLFFLGLSILKSETWIMPGLSAAWYGFYSLLFFTFVTGLLIVYGFRNTTASVGSLVISSEMISATLVGYLFYAEVFGLLGAIGAILVMSAGILAVISDKDLAKD